jgi:hypothetical protein
MRFRFIRVLALAAVLAGTFAGIARALDFEDEDPHPPRGEVGMVYSYEIDTTGGCLPHRLEVLSGQLPPGTTIRPVDYDTHEVEGVMTQAGTFNTWLAVRDCDNRSAELLFTFDVGPRRFSIATDSLPPAGIGAPYSATLQTAGIDSSTTWELTAGSLPAGLTLSPAGVISGTPTAGGTATFTVEATGAAKDSSGTRVDSKQVTLSVESLSASLSEATAEVGIPFRATLQGSGGQAPYQWQQASAPAGLAIAANGTVSGTPKRAGTYTLSAHVVDATGAATTVQVRLVVVPRLRLATAVLRAATAGKAYRATLALRGGARPYRWSAVGLPSGIRLAASGILLGTPRAKGAFHVRVRVRDALGAVSAKTLVLTVR